MRYETLLFEIRDGIAFITINRPDKLNALNNQVVDELADAAERVATEAAIKGVILTGAGQKAFVAGADISDLAKQGPFDGKARALRGQAMLRRFETCGKPVIAAVNGYALGGGCELAMACHLRLASESARFGQPEVKLGITPGYGGTQRLPRLVGKGVALQLILTAEPIDAREAHRIGLVNKVVPGDQLLAWHDLVHEADAMRLPGVDRLGGENQLQRDALADQPRQALRAAVPRGDAELHFGLPEPRGLAREAEVTRHRQLAPAPQRVPVHRRDD